jgi:hypothetical protein
VNKLRTTPNAWQAVLTTVSGTVREWLEASAEVHPTVVNLTLDPTHPTALLAAQAISAGTYAGRTKGAVQKIIDALSGTMVEPPVATVPPPVPVMDLGAIVGQLKSDEADKLQNMFQTLPTNLPPEVSQVVQTAIQTKLAAVQAPTPTLAPVEQAPEKVESSAEAAELDLILNPTRSIREAMAELAKSLKE